jgi:glutathione synthase/RimK-type ligase-like ATP-grasp enzyme
MDKYSRTAILKNICKKRNIRYSQSKELANLITIHTKQDFIFYGRKSPFNTVSAQGVTKSKIATYSLLKTTNLNIPKSAIVSKKNYRNSEVVEKIKLLNSSFPIVIKPSNTDNSKHVYVCEDIQDTLSKMEIIFQDVDISIDLIIAQEYINIVTEYRVVVFNTNILNQVPCKYAVIVAYEKLKLDQRFSKTITDKNVVKSDIIRDKQLLDSFTMMVQQLADKIPGLNFAGIDFAIDADGKIWFIEVNGNPGFKHLREFHGDEAVTKLYTDILDHIQS